MGRSTPSRAIRSVWLASPTTVPSRITRAGGILDPGPRVFVDDIEHLLQGPGRGLGLAPAGELLGHGIHADYASRRVGSDDGVADAIEGRADLLLALPAREFRMVQVMVQAPLPVRECQPGDAAGHDNRQDHEEQHHASTVAGLGKDLAGVDLGHHEPGRIRHGLNIGQGSFTPR